jgi:hypothetical protein
MARAGERVRAVFSGTRAVEDEPTKKEKKNRGKKEIGGRAEGRQAGLSGVCALSLALTRSLCAGRGREKITGMVKEERAKKVSDKTCKV